MDLREWVNSGLMTFFFFVVGLEARREFDMGELRERRRVTLPLVAGLGGMAVPVLIYLAVNAGHGSAHGWGTAMSTDTAFALGMLALVGPRFPERLRSFMLTVVVVDDVAALIVIATVYSGDVWSRPSPSPVALLVPSWLSRAAGVRVGLVYAAARRGALGGAPEVGRRPDPGGARDGPADLRLPGAAHRPRARERPLPPVPGAADAGAGPVGPGRPADRHLAERAPAAALPPLDELRDRAAVRPRERRDRGRRRASSRTRSPRRSRSGSWSATSSASRSAWSASAWLVTAAQPRPAAAAGGLGGGRRRRHGRGHRLHRVDPDRDARVPRARARGGEAGRAVRGARLVGRDVDALPRHGAAAEAAAPAGAARLGASRSSTWRCRSTPTATTSAARSTRR